MSSATSKPLVLVYGGTGATGSSIVDGLVKRGHFDVGILTRPASASKPAVLALKDKGVQVRVGDAATDDVETLAKALSGAEVLISAVSAYALQYQYRLFDAAKVAGVKRVVPCDFGTYTPRGVRAMADLKYAIRDYIDSLGIGHTYIDVGWWMQLSVPYPSYVKPNFVTELLRSFAGEGDKKNALTGLHDIGKFVARIVEDPRTINQYVFVWGEERTGAECWAVAQRIYGEDLESRKVRLSGEDLLRTAKEAKEKIAADPSAAGFEANVNLSQSEYQYSMHIRGDNTVANAKAAGALDARELYPDVEVTSFEEFVKQFYANPPTLYEV
ncbi:NAD(P)-binding protein [Punctularia strigosozonata HHB-11173 SS5]|uniref:NAD(P)-binding protein n=1 Tax=Punctularia strigosozonata (strain HHB-11173) TaxID=741275 RepID=UPI0004418336|nr:NAD(P)-binding protein [Punctularia strigosozonata HHB-11173 SS5]EIN05580.1 NAD(P)-binding protein [Punctularia strigosozonata HHB-11173 SS5]